MINNNISNEKLFEVQKIIDDVGKNATLKLFQHNSSFSFYEFVENIYNSYKKNLQNKIKLFKHFTLLIDESVDVCCQNQLSVYICYIDSNFVPTTSFMALLNIGLEGGTAINLKNIIYNLLDKWELDKTYLVAISTDGAASMIGKYNGLIETLRKNLPSLMGFYCYLHRLNLANKFPLEKLSLKEIKQTLQICNDIANYIHSSSSRKLRYAAIDDSVKNTLILQPVATRWSSNWDWINSIVTNFNSMHKFILMEQSIDQSDSIILIQKKIHTNEFLENISILYSILKIINVAIINLQKINNDICIAKQIIHKLIYSLIQLKTSKQTMELYKRLFQQYSEFTRINHQKKLQVKNKNVEKEIKKKIEEYVDLFITKVNEKFEDDITDEIVELLDVSLIYDDDKKWEEKKKKYGNFISKIKNRFNNVRYDERFEDYQLFKSVVHSNNNYKKLQTFKDVCVFIISEHYLRDAPTIVRFAHICLLLCPTTVIVENGYD
jgi:hypothetical protein